MLCLLEPSADGRVVWHWMGSLYVAGGLLTFGSVLSGLDSETDEHVIVALGATATTLGVIVLLLARRIPANLVSLTMLTALGLITGVLAASHEPDSPFLFFYFWVGVAAWFFLRTPGAMAITLITIAVTAVAVAVMSGADPDPDAGAWWLMTVGSLIALSTLAGVLHGRAQRLVAHDELTGLLNRRGYQQRVNEEIARARRYGVPLSIVLGDLDHFKALNDRFGHSEGDQALREFGAICRRQLRDQTDSISRVGGEEFAVVLLNTPETAAILVAERLRRRVSEELRTPDGAPVTASFGVATFPQHGDAAQILLDHADQAMYAAKALGRDRTMAFADSLPRASQPPPEQEQIQAVVMLAETIDLRDAGTGAHSETVARLSQRIAIALDLPHERVERIRLAGLLHDVGKIGVPDDVLRKAGPLDAAEWAEMHKHPEVGARMVEAAGLRDIAGWVLAHHEQPDGNGYPRGLSGDEIPLEARILAVADAYEAMTADRPYRRSIGEMDAVAELARGASTQFDEDVVRAFMTGVPGAAALTVPVAS